MRFEVDYRTALLQYAPLAAALASGSPASYNIGVRLSQPAVFPSIRFQRISTARMYSMEGQNALCQARVQNDCWSNTNTGALALGDLLIQAIDTLTLGGRGKPNFIVNQWFDQEAEPEQIVYRVIIDAKIYFIDSV